MLFANSINRIINNLKKK